MLPVTYISEAEGASYFNLFSNTSLIMEFRNCIINEYGVLAREAPKVVKIIPNNAPMLKLRGWLMGGNPSESTWVLEEKEMEYLYQISSYSKDGKQKTLDIEAPNKSDFWEVYGIERNEKQTNAVVVFSRPLTKNSDRRKKKEELWIISFDLINGKILKNQIFSMTLLDGYASSLSINDKNIVLVGFDNNNSKIEENTIQVLCLNNSSLHQIWRYSIKIEDLEAEYILDKNTQSNTVVAPAIMPQQKLTLDFFRLTWGAKIGNLGDGKSRLIAFGMTNPGGVDAQSFVYISYDGRFAIHYKNMPIAQILNNELEASCYLLKSSTGKVAGENQIKFEGIEQWDTENEFKIVFQNENNELEVNSIALLDKKILITSAYTKESAATLLSDTLFPYLSTLHRNLSKRIIEKTNWIKNLP